MTIQDFAFVASEARAQVTAIRQSLTLSAADKDELIRGLTESVSPSLIVS